jgi:CHASE2 domain-containing sensor protein
MTSSTSHLRTVVTLVAIGTICWLVAGIIALVLGAESKVIWTCLAGAVLGTVGIRYTIRRSRRSGI